MSVVLEDAVEGLDEGLSAAWDLGRIISLTELAAYAARAEILKAECFAEPSYRVASALLAVKWPTSCGARRLAPPAAEHHHRTHAGIHRVPQRAAAKLHVATQLVAAGISNPGKNKPLGAHVAHLRNIQHAFNTHHRQRSCGRA
jgi:hypothetical protein